MTPILRILRRAFFQGVCRANEQENKLVEARVKMSEAKSELNGALTTFKKTSIRVHQMKSTNDRLIELAHEIQASLDGK